MKTRYIILILVFILSGIPVAWAQGTMTDNQVMEFVLRENDKGTSRAEITKKLLEKGVSIDQLRRVRSTYEKQQKGDQLGARSLSGYNDADRIRTNNGGSRPDPQLVKQLRAVNNSHGMRGGSYEEELQGLGLSDSLEVTDDWFFPEDEEADPTKRVFGRSIFNSKRLSFESDMNVATPSDYVLGAGDIVQIDVWGNTAKSFACTVTPDGDVVIEDYGIVSVGGMTVAQAERRLKSTLGSRYQGSNLKLTVGQTKTISVNIFGEVKYPGTYTLSAFATVFNALYMAGGPNDIGTLRDIKVMRNGRVIASVDIYDFILNGNATGNVRLATNDVIYVGTYDCLVQIQGKVKRPMFYEMKSSESVATLVKYAGGFAGDAQEDNVRLTRKKGGQLSVYTLDEFERGTFQLADADSLFVDSTLQRYTNMVEIKGAVRRPGQYQMDGGVTTVRALLERAGGFLEESFAAHAVMHRRKANRQLEVLSFDAAGILNHEVADIPLRNEDVVFIPSLTDYQSELTFSILGEVNYPGTYEYAENTTIEDLILQAGGLTDAASTVKVDVSRRMRDNGSAFSAMETAENFSFSLREGFVVDGQPGFVLQPFDEVYVRRSPGYVEQGHIRVSGEIAFAGDYSISKKNMRLSEVVTLAGGVNASGYAHGAHLIRRISPSERAEREVFLRHFLNNSVGLGNDTVNLRLKMLIGQTKSVGIELDKALANPGDDRWDLVVEDGDELIIPGQLNTVDITGEVMYPNSVTYNKDMRASDYIDQAGGYSRRALKSRAFAINPNGTVRRLSHYSRVEPGATIIIPAKKVFDRMAPSQILSMTMSMASLAAVLVGALK